MLFHKQKHKENVFLLCGVNAIDFDVPLTTKTSGKKTHLPSWIIDDVHLVLNQTRIRRRGRRIYSRKSNTGDGEIMQRSTRMFVGELFMLSLFIKSKARALGYLGIPNTQLRRNELHGPEASDMGLLRGLRLCVAWLTSPPDFRRTALHCR